MEGSLRSILLQRCAFAIAIASCASPTEIHVTVFTDVACNTGAQASIVGGSSLSDLANKAPAGASTECNPAPDGTNSLGDVVLQPSADKSAEVAFEFMIRPDGAPSDSCSDPANAASCIIARRQIHFSQHTEISMRVDLRVSCLGVVCSGDDTCVQGQCVPAATTCTGASCTESSLLPIGGGATHFNRIAGGQAHTCAITSTGGVKCWGDNSRGELGDGTNNESHVPVQVKGLTSGVISLATGENFTCALMSTRTVKCWGKNDYGEGGNGTNTDTTVPTDVSGLTDVDSFAAGCKHMCVSLASGGVKCWGWDDEGQLGDGTNNNNNMPVDVKGISTGALYVTGGFHSSCAAFPNGAQCWGDDSTGELGDGKQVASNVPVDTTQLTFGPTVMTSGAYHVFAYGTGNAGTTQFATWGVNPFTGGLKGSITNASAGDGYTCALQNGAVLCWGKNDQGQLGRGANGASDQNAAQVKGLVTGVTEIGAGYDHACAFVGTDKIQCWGNNSNGELGNNSTTEADAPVDVVWP
jgi:hypothetical protein